LDVTDANAIAITNSTAVTLNRITGGTPGQILLLGPVVAPLTIKHTYGGPGSIYIGAGTDIKLALYEWALMLLQQDTWILISRAASTADPVAGTSNGGELRRFRVPSCVTPASVGGVCTMTVTLPSPPYTDANYRVLCSVYNSNALALVGNTSMKTQTTFNINIVAGTSAATKGTLECLAVHD
jgi:hypothetical protein